MATIEAFFSFDSSPYQRIPVVNTPTTLVLGQALRALTPAEAPAGVVKRAKRLDAAIEDAEELFTALVRLLQQDELVSGLEELVGPQLVRAIIDVQPMYEKMVADRLADPDDELASLSEIQRQLRKRIADYSTQVLAMVDEDEPESLDIVVTALRPIVTLREFIALRGREAEAEMIEALNAVASGDDDDAEDEAPDAAPATSKAG